MARAEAGAAGGSDSARGSIATTANNHFDALTLGRAIRYPKGLFSGGITLGEGHSLCAHQKAGEGSAAAAGEEFTSLPPCTLRFQACLYRRRPPCLPRRSLEVLRTTPSCLLATCASTMRLRLR